MVCKGLKAAICNSRLLQWNPRVYKFIEDFDLGMRDEWLPHGDEAGHDVSEWLLRFGVSCGQNHQLLHQTK